MQKNNIIFDLDNTLMDFKYTEEYAVSCLYKELGLSYTPSNYEDFYKFQLHFWHEFENSSQELESGHLSKIDYIRAKLYVDYFKSLNLSIDEGYNLLQVYINNLGVKNQVYEGVDDILNYLSKKYPLYIASNGPRSSQIRKLKNTSLLKYFKEIVTAEDLGYSKPSINFFNGMLDYFSIIPSDTVFIGDSLSSDISGANNVRIHSIWYNRNHGINNTPIIPNQEITDLNELKKIL